MAATEAPPRECECAKGLGKDLGIIRCVHFGEQVIWFVDQDIVVVPPGHSRWLPERWRVLGPATVEECRKCGLHRIIRCYCNFATDDRATAATEFDRRGALLLEATS